MSATATPSRKSKKTTNRRQSRTRRRFSTNLHDLREKAGLTQQQAAYGSGLSQSYFQWLERGFCMPSLAVATRIAATLNVEVGAIRVDPVKEG